MRAIFLNLFGFCFLCLASIPAQAFSPYLELGTSLGKLSSLDRFYNLGSSGTTSNLGFCGSFSFYIPVTPPKLLAHFDLGIQNRMYFLSTNSPQKDFTFASTNISFRFEFYRFYVGAGYSPFAFGSTDGALKTKLNPDFTSGFVEVGAIWRIVPELQIVATYAMEYGILHGGGTLSPSPAYEYGLRFRFPLNTQSYKDDVSNQFDGFRYPFGFMK